MVSYELSVGLAVVVVIMGSGTMGLMGIGEGQHLWYVVGMLPVACVYWVSVLAETGRVPIDLPEGESELVSGYTVEYGGMTIGLLILGEYGHMVVMSSMGVMMILGGGEHVWVKATAVLLCMVWIRGTLPRIRYDQLMGLLWRQGLVLMLGMVVVAGGVLVSQGGAP